MLPEGGAGRVVSGKTTLLRAMTCWEWVNEGASGTSVTIMRS